MNETKGWRLPEHMRQELARPFGPIIDEKRLQERKDSSLLVTVGDIVSLTAMKLGIRPHLIVYDGRTERREMTGLSRLVEEEGYRIVTVRNPPGTISNELMEAVKNALKGCEPMSIRVEGEEDLAVLACILYAPVGSWVVYGQPGEGMVLIEVDEDLPERIKELWNRMEELP
ncbi:MAG TPA: DUF359 domain-containing protein [Candidatus Methanomethylophilaceae archaeon]|nr:GTP-dependent dephospho-CoA kinase [Candidatus Methanomethylophilaceae archaeon]HII99993.1 DUF359 domain-containing protein [Candidatus Methanomethylophilaceae archaeon]